MSFSLWGDGARPTKATSDSLRSQLMSRTLSFSSEWATRLHGYRDRGIVVGDQASSMIASFGDRATEGLFHNRPISRARRFPNDVVDQALIKLDMLNGATVVLDPRSPHGNRLETLKGDLNGFHSIRVNDQWRLVFRWDDGNASDVRLMDYHK